MIDVSEKDLMRRQVKLYGGVQYAVRIVFVIELCFTLPRFLLGAQDMIVGKQQARSYQKAGTVPFSASRRNADSADCSGSSCSSSQIIN